MLLDKVFHLLLAPGVHAALQLDPMLCSIIFDHLVGAETLMAFPAIHQRIGKSAQMSGGYPCLGIHQDRAVYADVVRILHDEFLPPGFLYIVFQFHSQRAVIPGIGKTAVNFRTRIYKASGLCQCYNLIHSLFHNIKLLSAFL